MLNMVRIDFGTRSRQALTLKGLGYTYREIANIMGLKSKNPGSYLNQAKITNETPMGLTETQIAGIHKRWGIPKGVEQKPEMDIPDDVEVVPEAMPVQEEGKKRSGRPKKSQQKKVVPKKTEEPKIEEKPVVEEEPEIEEDEVEEDQEIQLDFTLGQEVIVKGKWKGKHFTKKAKIMGMLTPGQDINSLFDKPPAKKNVYRIGDIDQPRLAVVSEVGKIKSYFDPTEDMLDLPKV